MRKRSWLIDHCLSGSFELIVSSVIGFNQQLLQSQNRPRTRFHIFLKSDYDFRYTNFQ